MQVKDLETQGDDNDGVFQAIGLFLWLTIWLHWFVELLFDLYFGFLGVLLTSLLIGWFVS